MILIAAVGQKLPDWVTIACEDYLARFPANFKVLLKEVKAEPRTTGKSVAEMKQLEAQRLVSAVSDCEVTVALDERGKSVSTAAFATFLEKLEPQTRAIGFLIGGPDGLDDALKARCDHQLCLSAMTLPHGLARVLLTEQLYRAWSLLNHHPYHRA